MAGHPDDPNTAGSAAGDPDRRVATWVLAHDPLVVDVLADPLVERVGYPVRHPYIEIYWLPILGPSATWMLRRLALYALADRRIPLPLHELGRELGLSSGTQRNSPVVRTLVRLVNFAAARPDGDVLLVRRALAPLSQAQLRRLPAQLAATAADAPAPDALGWRHQLAHRPNRVTSGVDHG